jgi:hypothetical protein
LEVACRIYWKHSNKATSASSTANAAFTITVPRVFTIPVIGKLCVFEAKFWIGSPWSGSFPVAYSTAELFNISSTWLSWSAARSISTYTIS